MKPCFRIVFLFLIVGHAHIGWSQQQQFTQSESLNLPLSGWNKVLCLKNGFTFLFHMDPMKSIQVKVFDSTHKLVSERKDAYSQFDGYENQEAVFKGAIEVGGEAVLFFQQEKFGKTCFIRERYEGATGRLLEDKIIAESPSHKKKTYGYVMKQASDSGYAILFVTDDPEFKVSDLKVAYYDAAHNKSREVPLVVDRKKYDFLNVLCAEIRPNGIMVSLSLDKETEYGRANHNGINFEGASKYDHFITMYFIPKNATVAYPVSVDATRENYPFYGFYTWNKFAGVLNSFVFCNKPFQSGLGIYVSYKSLRKNMLFRLSETDLSLSYGTVNNVIATSKLTGSDSGTYFPGVPVSLHTNDNGMSTLISQNYLERNIREVKVRPACEEYFGDICVTEFGDDGNEIWGTILPLSQFRRSFEHFYPLTQMARKKNEHFIFGDRPPEVYSRQFVLTNQYYFRGNHYIIFNDYDKNFNNSVEAPGDTVYNFNLTNAFYYKVGRKQEVTKAYLFGKPTDNSYRCSFVEGADFDEKRGTYASLVQYKKESEISLCMTWAKLD